MANTTGVLSEAGIASMAAGLLDDYHVSSLNDNSPLGKYMAREFGIVRREILEAYPWHIAKTRAVLTTLADAPAFDWTYQYQLPDDCLRVLPPDEDGTFNGVPIPHEVESGKLLCNFGPTLRIKYIRDEQNVRLFTALMGRAFAAKMALYASQRVTGKAAYFEKARTAYLEAVNEAKLIDSLTRGSLQSYVTPNYDGLDSLSVREQGY